MREKFPHGVAYRDVDGTERSIKIQNLEWDPSTNAGAGVKLIWLGADHPSGLGGGRCPDVMAAGTLGGDPAIMVYDTPDRPGFDRAAVFAAALNMGVCQEWLEKCIETQFPREA